MQNCELSLSDESIEKIKGMLLKEEGFRQFPYRDTVGKLTIGIGRNLDDRGISKDEALYLMCNDLEIVEKELRILYPFYEELCDARKIVLLDMAFNMGIPALSHFIKFKRAMESGDFKEASLQMLDSLWARQVGHRASILSYMMEFGKV